MKRTVVVALGMLLVMLVPASVAAEQPHQVDPALMQPALNPTFAPWDCWRNGARHRLRRAAVRLLDQRGDIPRM